MHSHQAPTRDSSHEGGGAGSVVLALLGVVVAVVASPATANARPGSDAIDPSGQAVVSYQPPVDAPVTDPFRPPLTPYGPGNRGIDYATVPGDTRPCRG